MIGIILGMINFYFLAFNGNSFIEDGGALGMAALIEIVIEFCIGLFFVNAKEFR